VSSRRWKLAAAAAFLLVGCATVKPWEREHLAKPCMETELGQHAMALQYREKVLESTTAGGLPGQAPGGGCGCTQ
jgi:hypothetical protein